MQSGLSLAEPGGLHTHACIEDQRAVFSCEERVGVELGDLGVGFDERAQAMFGQDAYNAFSIRRARVSSESE